MTPNMWRVRGWCCDVVDANDGDESIDFEFDRDEVGIDNFDVGSFDEEEEEDGIVELRRMMGLIDIL